MSLSRRLEQLLVLLLLYIRLRLLQSSFGDLYDNKNEIFLWYDNVGMMAAWEQFVMWMKQVLP